MDAIFRSRPFHIRHALPYKVIRNGRSCLFKTRTLNTIHTDYTLSVSTHWNIFFSSKVVPINIFIFIFLCSTHIISHDSARVFPFNFLTISSVMNFLRSLSIEFHFSISYLLFLTQVSKIT